MVIGRFGLTLAVLAAVGAVALAIGGRTPWLDTMLAITSVVYLPVALVGAAMVRSRRRNPVGWIFLVSGVAMSVSALLQTAALVLAGRNGVGSAGAVTLFLVGTFFLVFSVPLLGTFGVLLFPDGRLGSRRRRVLAWLCGADLVLLAVWAVAASDQRDDVMRSNPLAPGTLVDGLVLTILVMGPLIAATSWALLRRSRTEPAGRAKAVRLAAYTGFVASGAYFCCLIAGLTTGQTEPIAVLENLAAVALGVAAWIGIVRYGLFDRRAVLSRALVYGSLTVVVVTVYAVATVLLGLVAGGVVPQVVASALAALAVLPLRDAAQRRANTLIYGLRDDPATALRGLGASLDAVADPDDVLPAAVRTVAGALRLPYVAVEVGGTVLAAAGQQAGDQVEQVALPFAGETIGHLVLQRRQPEDAAERTLLADLARQVAVAARAVVLTRALQQSRERLVSLREEERRRLRRDLHDGLGPTLAGIALGIDTVRRALPGTTGPAATNTTDPAALLGRLRAETEGAVADIRRIVYDLRPPILDELGLAGAVREQASRLGGATVTDVGELPALPAAVEVAAYRIAVEALTNASRHAPGAPVTVRLSANGRLELEVTDGGAGIPDGFSAGVGITSMRERAAELGGRLTVRRDTGKGTLVRAELPLEPA